MWAYRRGALSGGQAPSIRGGVRGTNALRVFTVAQVSAAVIVAIGAGLLVRSLDHLRTIDRGFDSHNLLMMSLLLPENLQRDPTAMLAFYNRLLPEIVRSATLLETADAASVMLVDESGEYLRIVAHHGLSEEYATAQRVHLNAGRGTRPPVCGQRSPAPAPMRSD